MSDPAGHDAKASPAGADHDADHDPDLAAALRAVDARATVDEVAALRARIRRAAAPVLAERAALHKVPRRGENWLDATSRFGRWAIPASLAASLLAAILLQWSSVGSSFATRDELYAFAVVADTSMSPLVTEQWMLPTSADAVLLEPLDGAMAAPAVRP